MCYLIRHQTRYRYTKPVTLLPHRMLLTPRGGAERQLLDFALDCGPDARIAWTDDVFANRVAIASFASEQAELLIDDGRTDRTGFSDLHDRPRPASSSFCL